MGKGINEIPSALQTVQFLKDKQLVDVERPEPKLEPETYNMPTDSSLNTDMLWWQGADNSTQRANATQTQMPAFAPNSSKNTATDVVKGIGAGVNALGVAAAVVYAGNNGVHYSDDIVTYNRITKTLTIKSDFYTDDALDVINLQYKNIGIGEAETIVIDDGVKKVKLYGVDFPHVKKIIVSKTVSEFALVEDIAGLGLDSLEEIEVDKNNPSYTSIDGVLFEKDEDDLGLIKFPAGKTDKEYKVPTSVKYIAEEAFYSCSNLEKITMENDLVLGQYSFRHCENLKEVWFNSPIDEAEKDKNAFYLCQNAKLYYMPKLHESSLYGLEVVTDTSDGANNSNDLFYYDETTKTLIIRNEIGCDEAGKSILLKYENTGINEAEFIKIATNVGAVDFSSCNFKKVKKILVSKTVSFLDFNKAAFDSLEEIEVSFGSPYYWSGNGVLFDRTKKFLVILKKFPAGKTDKEYAVPTFVGDIAREAFDSCSNLEKITMENDLVLESNSFSNCENLKEVCFNSQENTAKKSKDAFSQCGNAKVYMPNMNQDQLPQTFGGLPVIKGAPPQQQP